jgi:hypothetical protein
MKGSAMASVFFRIMVGMVVMGGTSLALMAQDRADALVRKDEPKLKKVKLFDGPAFVNKAAKGASSSGVIDALRDKTVQDHIGLLPMQVEELQRLTQQVTAELEPILADFNKRPKAEQGAAAEALRKEMATYLRGVQADVDKILLPEQQQRLQQAAFQMRIQRAGMVETLVSPDVLRELGLDDAQAERFRESLQNVEEEHQRKLQELEIEKERKILALLPSAQQNKLKSMIGPLTRGLTQSAAPAKGRP